MKASMLWYSERVKERRKQLSNEFHLMSVSFKTKSNQGFRDKDQTWKTDAHNKEHTITKIIRTKATKVNEQLGLH